MPRFPSRVGKISVASENLALDMGIKRHPRVSRGMATAVTAAGFLNLLRPGSQAAVSAAVGDPVWFGLAQGPKHAGTSGQPRSIRHSHGPESQGDHPRPEVTAIHEFEPNTLAQTVEQRRSMPSKNRLHKEHVLIDQI